MWTDYYPNSEYTQLTRLCSYCIVHANRKSFSCTICTVTSSQSVQSHQVSLYSHIKSVCTVTSSQSVQSHQVSLYSHIKSVCTVTSSQSVQSHQVSLYSHIKSVCTITTDSTDSTITSSTVNLYKHIVE